LYLCTRPADWSCIHPALRASYTAALVPRAEDALKRFNIAYGEAKAAATFTLDDLTAAQKDTLKRGIENDFATFYKRHPNIASNWKATQSFLGQ
jgi:hypothetical protein